MANTHSIDFDLGSSEGADRADTASLSITGDISCEAWIKLDQLPSDATTNMRIISKFDGDASKRSYLLQILAADDKLQFVFSHDGSASSDASMDTAFTSGDVGTWVHVAATADVSSGASGILTYKNGALVANSDGNSNSTAIHDNASKFGIGLGHDSDVAIRFFDGMIDEARVWSDIRTANEIAQSYRTEVGTGNNLQGYWKFNNNYLDSSGNGNTLTAVATPTFPTDVPFTTGGSFLFNMI